MWCRKLALFPEIEKMSLIFITISINSASDFLSYIDWQKSYSQIEANKIARIYRPFIFRAPLFTGVDLIFPKISFIGRWWISVNYFKRMGPSTCYLILLSTRDPVNGALNLRWNFSQYSPRLCNWTPSRTSGYKIKVKCAISHSEAEQGLKFNTSH